MHVHMRHGLAGLSAILHAKLTRGSSCGYLYDLLHIACTSPEIVKFLVCEHAHPTHSTARGDEYVTLSQGSQVDESARQPRA